MKVLVDLTQIPIQKVGVGVYAQETFSVINKNAEMFFLLQDDDNELYNKLFDKGRVILIKSKFFRVFILRFLLEQIFIPLICYKYKIDVLHSLHYSFPLFIYKVKRVVTIHDLTFFIYPDVHTFIKRLYFKFFIKKACKYVDFLICVSESTKNDLNKYVKDISACVQVVPLSCSLKIDFSELEKESIKKNFNIKDKYILFIGTLEPRKNILNLIKAFHIFLSSNKEFTLVVIGKKGWFYESIFKLVEELNISDKVIFTGFVTTNEKYAILSDAYVFIYPSIYEGFGLPVLESINYEIPTITSNLSSLPEVAGNAAFYINPHVTEDIKNALELVCRDMDLRNRLIINSRLQKNKFSWNKTAISTYSIYDKL